MEDGLCGKIVLDAVTAVEEATSNKIEAVKILHPYVEERIVWELLIEQYHVMNNVVQVKIMLYSFLHVCSAGYINCQTMFQ